MDKLKITILYDGIEDREEQADADVPVYRQISQVLEKRGHQIKLLAAEPKIKSLVSQIDRKSTRVNSSHGYISYAVFCLKKKKKKKRKCRSPNHTGQEGSS